LEQPRAAEMGHKKTGRHHPGKPKKGPEGTDAVADDEAR
jgi:hypothetical protein